MIFFIGVVISCVVKRLNSRREDEEENYVSSSPYGAVSNPYAAPHEDVQRLLGSSGSSVNGDGDSSRRSLSPETEEEILNRAGCLVRIGLVLEEKLMLFFRWWGQLCCEHPFKVIFGSIVVIGALTCGVLRVQITTDPVELWSMPTSESRLQKDYFDEHFGPFYRTEQVIITAPNVSGSEYLVQTGTNVYKVYFGSALQKKVLDEVRGAAQ